MDFAGIRHALESSTPDDWHLIPEGRIGADEHHYRAVFGPNVELTLAWGAKLHDPFTEPWANQFADKSASSHLIDVNYAGALVDRLIFVYVDGSRGMIPLPEPVAKGDDEVGWQVESWRLNLVRTLHGLSGGTYDFDRYFLPTGIAVVDEPGPLIG